MFEVVITQSGTSRMRLLLLALLVAVPALHAYNEFGEKTREEVSKVNLAYLYV